jgi:hypothetical protein
MPGIWFCSLWLLILGRPAADTSLAGAAVASLRFHEIQLRHNDYAVAPEPELLQTSGFSKVILRVFSDDEKHGGLYFLNSVFKTVRPVLESWIPQFVDGKLGLWAWMGSRYFSWLKNSQLLDVELRNGQRRVIPKLDLFNPDAEALIVALFRELARKPIQGILIQDDLTLRRHEGFSNWGKAYFSRSTGLPADERQMAQAGSAQGLAWARCKCERIAQLVEKIVQACKAVNPQIKIAMNIHYEIALAPDQARSWYSHDLSALSASSLDYLYLMAYHRQMQGELGLNESASRIQFAKMTAAALASFGPRLVVKLQVRDWRTSALIPLDELRSYYDLIPAGVGRVCFAAVDPEDIALVSQIFNR